MSGYAEHAPPPPLRHLVACGWTLTRATADPGHRVLPDGCMDIVVTPTRTTVAGPATRAFDAPMGAGSFAAGVRFRPGAAASVLGIAAHELRDGGAPLDAIWAGTAIDADDADEALRRMWALLLGRAGGFRGPDQQVLGAASAIAADPAVSISDVACAVGLSDRQLRRRFDDHVGHGPKVLARVVRLQRLLRTPTDASWARRAADAGYADQAHLVRECRALTGVTPTAL